MKNFLLKLLFVGLLLSGSAIYSQTALPGTVEAESGTFGGIVGPSGVGVNNLRGGSANFVQNSVQVTSAGDYDFTFTYNRTGSAAASVTMEIVSPFETLFSGLSFPQTSGFETVTIEDVTLPAGTYDLKFYNANGNGFNLDKYEVVAATAKPTITLLGSDPVNVTQGGTYTDAGATALASDGTTDITGSIVVGGDTVDTSTLGAYIITYNVTDGGDAADEVTRTVNVIAATTSLPGTIEVETGDLSQNNAHYARNIVGDGNSGTSNVVLGWRKTRIEANPGDGESGAGVDGTIINNVSVAADGNYDFTFTYFKNSADGVISINSTDASGGNSTQLASFTLNRNDATGGGTATTSSYTTQTVTGVALTTGITHITFTNADSKILNLDNVIVTTTPIPIALPGTIEVEDGDISNNQTSSGTRNVIGSGNGGTNNIISQFRRNSSVDGTIINYVSIAAGDYDFTFTYYKSSNSNTITINSTDASGGNSTPLHSFTLLKNSDTGATTSSYGTQTESVTIPAGVTYITITNPQPAAIDLDNVIVTADIPTITLLGSDPVNVTQGDTYTDDGATALASDGTTDITGSIVVGGDTVDTSTLGTYIITYNVTDGGVAADEVTRTVNVISASTLLPGTIEVEDGDLSQNNPNRSDRNIVGSGNGGTDNIVDNWRKTQDDNNMGTGIDGTIINNVTVSEDGNYDFTFTYFKNSNDNTITINSTDANGGNSTQLASFTLIRNDVNGTNTATTGSYSTQTVTGVPLNTGINYITFRNATSATLDLDNVIVTETPIPTVLPGTIEVETGDISNSDIAGDRPVVGDGNGGTDNVLLNIRRSDGKDAEIINFVSIASDGNYDFTFTYYKTPVTNADVRIYSTDSDGSNATELASIGLPQNSGTASPSSYGTITLSNVALTTAMNYITIKSLNTAIFDLDNVIVTETPIPTILPGTIEVETGDISNSDTAGDRPVVGDGNGGTDNVLLNIRRSAGKDAEIINFVSIASDGNYDFTFTYYKTPVTNADVRIYSTDSDGSNATELASIGLPQNSGTASPSSYGTITLSNVALTTAMNYITIKSLNTAIFDLDNVIVTPANPTVTSASDGDWDVGATWVGGVVPTATDNVIIDNHVVTVPVGYGAECIDLTVDAAGSLEINSGGSLRVSGTSTGNVTYNRNLATTNWYLVSSPVEGQGIADFYLNESPVLGNSGTGNSQLVAIAAYDNTQTLAEDRYLYYTEGQVDGEDGDDTTDTFGNGIGYTVKLQSAQDISFTGTVRTDNAGVPVTLSQGFNDFNLIGNPYLAFVNSTTFLTAESANVEPIFWMWNGSSYDTRMTGTHPDYMIAPGQGFWVEAKTTNAVTFTEANQSHETDNFQRSTNTRPEIRLNLSNGSENRKTEIFYIGGTTTGFDNGFDGKMFGGANSTPAIYTDLVSNSVGIKYAVQSLPNANYENMVIPVGVNAAANSEITFTADALNIPESYQVFIEDRDLGIFTRLDMPNAEYAVTVVNTSIQGRFFLHTKTPEALNLDSEFLSGISIHKTNNSNLRIEGLKRGKAVVRLYNLLGKQIMTNSFTAVNDVENIALPIVAKGVYIVQLETENGSLNKKIVF
jgi:hypothetical protein